MKARIKAILDVPLPEYQTPGSAGFDLTTAEGVTLEPGEVERVRTGLVVGVPVNHMMLITYRSSTPKKFGVSVLTGVIDSDYCGDNDELKLQVVNITDERLFLDAGSRIAQGVIIPVVQVEFQATSVMGASRGGFGSTG